MISELGVMGYPAKKRTPASRAPRAHARFPWMSMLLGSIFSRSTCVCQRSIAIRV